MREAARTQPFWLLVAAFFFGNACSQTLHVHQVAYLVDHGLSAIVAASVVSVVGLASIFGKTGGGWLSDRVERELVYVAGIMIMVASAFVLLALGASPTRWGAYGYAVLLGVGYSVTASLTPAMVSDRFSGRHFGAIVGIGLLGRRSRQRARTVDCRAALRHNWKLHGGLHAGRGLRRNLCGGGMARAHVAAHGCQDLRLGGVNCQLSVKGTLVGGPRFAAGDIGGNVGIFVQQT